MMRLPGKTPGELRVIRAVLVTIVTPVTYAERFPPLDGRVGIYKLGSQSRRFQLFER
jgi:hypothetical protein